MKKVMIYTALVLAAALVFSGCTTGGSSEPSASPSVLSESPSAQPSGETAAIAASRLISAEDAKALIGTEGVTLLDVRTQEEYDEAHIEGSILLPYDTITASSAGLPADKSSTVIIYCRSGRRSAIAAETLIGLGYTTVYDLGGIQSWPYETVSA